MGDEFELRGVTLVAASVAALAQADFTGQEAFELEDAALALHTLLSGEDGEGPLSFLSSEGDQAEPPLMVRLIEPDQVELLASLIESFPAKVIHERLESKALAAVAPFLGRPLSDDHKEWLLAVLHGLMVFVRRAAICGHTLVVVRP